MNQPPSIAQNADVRFLGKLLGDVIRSYGGQALFQRIEAIRAASVDRYRGIANPRGLAAGLDTLSLDETVAFVRSFMLFSMLANLAEDRQGAAAEEGSTLASALQFLSAQGVPASEAAALLDRALIVPVLTAHPTEVMRKSMLDHRNRIAALMRAARRWAHRNRRWRADRGGDRGADRPALADAGAAARAAVCGGRGRHRAGLFARHFSADGAGALRAVGALARARGRQVSCASAAGSAATATAIRTSPRIRCVWRWAARRRRCWPTISISSTRWAPNCRCRANSRPCPPTLGQLAQRSGDFNAARADEPYRRAITGIYARLAATLSKVYRTRAAAAGVGERRAVSGCREPARRPAGTRAVLAVAEPDGVERRAARLARLFRAVETFGFHLATLDLRQNADVHARVVAELLKVAGVSADYQALERG